MVLSQWLLGWCSNAINLLRNNITLKEKAYYNEKEKMIFK